MSVMTLSQAAERAAVLACGAAFTSLATQGQVVGRKACTSWPRASGRLAAVKVLQLAFGASQAGMGSLARSGLARQYQNLSSGLSSATGAATGGARTVTRAAGVGLPASWPPLRGLLRTAAPAPAAAAAPAPARVQPTPWTGHMRGCSGAPGGGALAGAATRRGLSTQAAGAAAKVRSADAKLGMRLLSNFWAVTISERK